MDKSHLLIDGRVALGAFDFDGNILRTPTKLYLINISTGEEEDFEWHMLDQHPEMISWADPAYRLHEKSYNSFPHFRDFSEHPEHHGADQLLQDVEYAIQNKDFSPSFESFKHTFLIKARLFAIITARGHSGENMARAMIHINNATLTQEEKDTQYKNICNLYSIFEWREATFSRQEEAVWYYLNVVARYYPLSSTIASNWLDIPRTMPSSQKKTVAMKHFIEVTRRKIHTIESISQKNISVGFSDDSVGNIDAMLQFFLQEKKESPKGVIHTGDKVRLYYTWPQWKFPTHTELGIPMRQRAETLVIQIQ